MRVYNEITDIVERLNLLRKDSIVVADTCTLGRDILTSEGILPEEKYEIGDGRGIPRDRFLELQNFTNFYIKKLVSKLKEDKTNFFVTKGVLKEIQNLVEIINQKRVNIEVKKISTSLEELCNFLEQNKMVIESNLNDKVYSRLNIYNPKLYNNICWILKNKIQEPKHSKYSKTDKDDTRALLYLGIESETPVIGLTYDYHIRDLVCDSCKYLPRAKRKLLNLRVGGIKQISERREDELIIEDGKITTIS